MKENSLYNNDVHMHFAACFDEPGIRPYAYWLSKKMADGHICVDVGEMMNRKEDLPFEKIVDPQEMAELNELVACHPDAVRPFIFYKNRFYLHRYFKYETQILFTLKRCMENESLQYTKRKAELESIASLVHSLASDIPSSEGEAPELNTDWQLVAAVSAYCNNFTIITGGPGTGKTTTVAKVLSLLFATQPNLRVALAAPTGKAATRMGESLKSTTLELTPEIRNRFQELEPATIHRLLGYQFGSIYFKHDQQHPLPYDVVIVDEASMIDVALFAKLLAAISIDTRLILLGDRNQLASVEAGSLFGDLCGLKGASGFFNSERASFINSFISSPENQIPQEAISVEVHPLMHHVIELKRSHRFGSNSGIGNFSRAVIENDVDVLNKILQNSPYDDVAFDCHMQPQVPEQLMENYSAYIAEPDIAKAIKAFNSFRILCALREGESGVYAMNKLAEKMLKKWKVKNADGSLFQPEGEFYENRPVIVTQNSKELELYNGDIGIVRKNHQNQYRVYFEGKDGNLREFPSAFIGKCETVFAMTIHKSQGSEYEKVLIMLPSDKDNPLLTRELLYTAVTRAKKQVVIAATEIVILQTASASVSRVSGINDRIGELAN